MASAFGKQRTLAGQQVGAMARGAQEAARFAAANAGGKAVATAGVATGAGGGGYEYALTLFAAALSLLLSGAGRYSVDLALTSRGGSASDPAVWPAPRGAR